jgi:hypothetical protein
MRPVFEQDGPLPVQARHVCAPQNSPGTSQTCNSILGDTHIHDLNHGVFLLAGLGRLSCPADPKGTDCKRLRWFGTRGG